MDVSGKRQYADLNFINIQLFRYEFRFPDMHKKMNVQGLVQSNRGVIKFGCQLLLTELKALRISQTSKLNDL